MGLKDWAKERWETFAWMGGAAFRSVLDLSIERYPRIDRNGQIDDLLGENLVPALAAATKPYENFRFSTPVEASAALDLIKASFDEVKGQTDYQDNKASRLLTITSFVSALSAVLLANFADRYPLTALHPFTSCQQLFIAATYLIFLAFTISALLGGVITFHATRTRFKYSKKPTATNVDDPAKSLLFYQEMVAVSPQGWAASFMTAPAVATGKPPAPPHPGTLREGLQEAYFRNYVMETYLIAAKTADKIRYLAPAQSYLAWALRWLIAFMLCFALAVCVVPSTKETTAPASISLDVKSNPTSVHANITPGPGKPNGSGK